MKKAHTFHDKPLKYASRPFAFRGLIGCSSCGATMSLDIAKGKYAYLFCNNCKKGKCNNKAYIKQEIVLEQMNDMLKGIQINDKTFADVRKFLEIRRNKGVKNRNADIKLQTCSENDDKVIFLLLQSSN
jgi:hypothetical protein